MTNAIDFSLQPNAVIDLQQALELTGGDSELLERIFQKFWSKYPDILSSLHNALSTGNSSEGQDAAHTLKGNAAYLCATEVRQCAANLEESFKENRLDDAREKLSALETAMEHLKAELKV